MTLLAVRDEFLISSGRQDLSTARANYFINAGQRYLDLQQPLDSLGLRYSTSWTADVSVLPMYNVRSIADVWYYDPDDTEYVQLNYLTPQEMVIEYPEYGSTTSGTPKHWTYDPSTTFDPAENTIILRVLPPPEETVTMVIDYIGRSAVLSSDSDTTTWTETFPDLLILAAIKCLDEHYGNNDRRAAMELAIKERLFYIDQQKAEREMACGHVMERSVEV